MLFPNPYFNQSTEKVNSFSLLRSLVDDTLVTVLCNVLLSVMLICKIRDMQI